MKTRYTYQNSVLSVVHSPINQAWFVMFGDTVLRVFNCKTEALNYADEIYSGNVKN